MNINPDGETEAHLIGFDGCLDGWLDGCGRYSLLQQSSVRRILGIEWRLK